LESVPTGLAVDRGDGSAPVAAGPLRRRAAGLRGGEGSELITLIDSESR